LRAHLVDDFGSFDEAADMGGENSIRAAFHTITSRESHPGRLSRLNKDLLLQYLPDQTQGVSRAMDVRSRMWLHRWFETGHH
jgi:hypothetical protein